MKEWVQVLRAADAAARWHVHQRRKGAAQEPYINHLLEVAMLVAEATEGKDPSLVVAALLLPGNPVPALFGIGAVTVLLLFIGIHNAWDTVTYVVLQQSQPENKSQD